MGTGHEGEIGVSLRTTQILIAALGMGVVSFYIIVAILALSNPAGLTPAPGFPLPAIGCVVAAVMTFASFVIKNLVLRRARQTAAAGQRGVLDLLGPYRTANVVAGALCEGGALALAVFVLAAGPGHLPWLSGGLISLTGFALHFPTREKLDAFLAEYGSDSNSSASE
jgi:hypothetical protein